ncbi:hypothetical protein Dimus_007768, partial [Dionaea muscipula]
PLVIIFLPLCPPLLPPTGQAAGANTMPLPTINRRSRHRSRRPAEAQPPPPLCPARSHICTASTTEEKTTTARMTEEEAFCRLHLYPKPKLTTARMMTEEAGGDVHHRWKQEEGDGAAGNGGIG